MGLFSFSNCQKLTKVIIPSSVTKIPYCCFEHCSKLVNIKFPENIELEIKCFWQCKSLSDISKENIPNEVIEENEVE